MTLSSELLSQAIVTVAADAADRYKEHSSQIISRGRKYGMRILFTKIGYVGKTLPPLNALSGLCEMWSLGYAAFYWKTCWAVSKTGLFGSSVFRMVCIFRV